MQQVLTDAKQLCHMTPDQLAKPADRDVLDDLVTKVTYGYIGQLDPITDTLKPGVLQAHYDVLKLATFDITKNVPKQLRSGSSTRGRSKHEHGATPPWQIRTARTPGTWWAGRSVEGF